METFTTAQMAAVRARLQAAYLEVALCESWLALHTQERATRHQHAADRANDRALEVANEQR